MHGAADVEWQWGVRVPVRDGISLHGILYLPKHPSRGPALCTMTAYGAQRHHEHGMFFAAHGYPFLSVDVRGRGDSEGEFRSHNEGRDGHDVVEWLSRQSYCDGKVAMWGASYLAYCQWVTAAESPPHLAAIAPAAATFRGVDTPMLHCIFPAYVVQWLTIVAGRTVQEKLFADEQFWRRKFKEWFEAGHPFGQLDALVGYRSAIFQEWLSHPHRDSYWDGLNPTPAQYSRLALPVLTITGCHDGDQPGALEHYRQHMANTSAAGRARHYLIIGPWDHAGVSGPKEEFRGIKVGPASLLDLRQLHLQWYDWSLRGGPRPEFMRQNVAYYVMGAEEWRYADSLEAITGQVSTLYLHSTANPTDVPRAGALLSTPAPDSGPDEYVYDPRDCSLAEVESTLDPESLVEQGMIHAARGRHLIYQSAAFDSDTDICGFFRLSAWLAIDQRDTDFRAQIWEICPDGSGVLLSSDLLRARYRQGFREEQLIDTPAALRYDFNNFTFIARRIRRGSCLRLVLGPLDSIHWQKNYNSGGAVAAESVADARVITVKLFHDAAHPTALHVPLGVQALRRQE